MKTASLRVPSQLTVFVRVFSERPAQLIWGNLAGALVFCVTMVVLAIWSTNVTNWQDVIVAENGPVERMSAGMWLMATVWCLVAGWKYSPHRIEWLGLTTLFLLFGLRELDAHVWATGWNLEKLANYWNPRVPLWERLLVMGFMIIPTMAVVAILCSRIWARFGEAWNNRAPWIAQMAVGGILLVFCVLFDKVGAYYLPFLGLEGAQLLFMVMEEFGEYALGVYAVSVLWPYWQEAFSSNGTGS